MSAPAVVLVHGTGSNFDHNWISQGWPDLLEDAGREVVGALVPGHGPGLLRGGGVGRLFLVLSFLRE